MNANNESMVLKFNRVLLTDISHLLHIHFILLKGRGYLLVLLLTSLELCATEGSHLGSRLQLSFSSRLDIRLLC